MILGSSVREQNKKMVRVGRAPSVLEEKDERSDRNQPKILTGSIKLPQVFGYPGGNKESNRVSYNFKYAVNELGLDKNLDKVEGNDAIFLGVIRRPRVYNKMESYLGINKNPTFEPAPDREITFHEPTKPRQERSSKSCPRPVVGEKPAQKYETHH